MGNHIPPQLLPLFVARYFPEVREAGNIFQFDDAIGFAIGGIGGCQPTGRDKVDGAGILLIIDLRRQGAYSDVGITVAVQIADDPHIFPGMVIVGSTLQPIRGGLPHGLINLDDAVRCAIGGICRREVFQRYDIGIAAGLLALPRLRRAEHQFGFAVAVQVIGRNAITQACV